MFLFQVHPRCSRVTTNDPSFVPISHSVMGLVSDPLKVTSEMQCDPHKLLFFGYLTALSRGVVTGRSGSHEGLSGLVCPLRR